MVVVTVVTESGTESTVSLAKNDLVAEAKERILAQCFPVLKGRLVKLLHHGHEMADEKSLGDYIVRNLKDARLMLAIHPRQPYANVDYARLSASLRAEGYKRPPAKFYQPGDEWEGTWQGGDAYKAFPPVDVDNPFSVVPPSSSRELTFSSPKQGASANGTDPARKSNVTCDVPERIQRKREQRRRRDSSVQGELEQQEREREFRRARQQSMGADFEGAPPSVAATAGSEDGEGGRMRGRQFASLYACVARDCHFQIVHKAEGKWMGDATFVNSGFQQPAGGSHVCSSKVGFHMGQSCWSEQQLITSSNGVSTKQHFWYHPQADGLLFVETDESFLRDCCIRLLEVGSHVVVLTATRDGQVVLTETTTYSPNFHSRVRTGQRFAPSGGFLASYTCRENKYVDEDSGALEPVAGF